MPRIFSILVLLLSTPAWGQSPPPEVWAQQDLPPPTELRTEEAYPYNLDRTYPYYVPRRRFLFHADYLLWTIRDAPLAVPLVTTADSPGPRSGFLGEPGTRVLLGQQDLDLGARSGLRLTAGVWIDPERRLGLEIGGFFLDDGWTGAMLPSSPQGLPILSRPVLNLANGQAESVYDIAYPGSLAGGFVLESRSRLQGLEANLVGYALGEEGFAIDLFAGMRLAGLEEELCLHQDGVNLRPLIAGGMLMPPGSLISISDLFWTRNHFYGGQVGARVEWDMGYFFLTLFGKLAVGVNDQQIRVRGETTILSTQRAHFPAGILASPGNLGTHNDSIFSILPEVGVTASIPLGPNLNFRVGYSFLYWSNILRPGNQMDRRIQPGQVPADRFFQVLPGDGGPSIPWSRSSFWAEGLLLGLDFRF